MRGRPLVSLDDLTQETMLNRSDPAPSDRLFDDQRDEFDPDEQ
ncbi:MAG: hypothetical protein ABSC94_29020 [Polyangiaceae bacterium]|jgi:hypothetical protein